jgi:REP element-mobilizing transposase RayT
MDRVWHFTWTTYGTRLPGDARGFVSNVRGDEGHGVRFNARGADAVSDIPPLEQYMRERLIGPPIYLTQEHADLLLPQFQETAAYRGWALLAVAVMTNHVHLVAGLPGDPDPSEVLGDFKGYGSRPLNRRWGKPASGTWWTEGGSKRKKADAGAILEAIRYVRTQENPFVVWLNTDTISAHFGERAQEIFASAGAKQQEDQHGALSASHTRSPTPVTPVLASEGGKQGEPPVVAKSENATYIEALTEYDGPGPSLFLAGGISGTFDWQADVVARLAELPLVLLNPRRRDFPINDPTAAPAQIEWEFHHLRRATAVLFWFPSETLCPIALYELGGRALVREQPLFVGTHPDYARRLDVEMQLKLARPEVAVVSDTEALAAQVRFWLTSGERGAETI